MSDLSQVHGVDMARGVVPLYKPPEVNTAGKIIRRTYQALDSGGNVPRPSLREWREAIAVLENFRASHQFPLNSFYMTLRNRARSITNSAVVSQRTKRRPSVINKLLDRSSMKLAEMQDIGGCRAIVPSLSAVYDLRDYYVDVPLAHSFSGNRPEVDYILEPREDTGYRSLHLKYRFKGIGKSEPYDGLRILFEHSRLLG